MQILKILFIIILILPIMLKAEIPCDEAEEYLIEAYYSNNHNQAKAFLEKALKLCPEYPEAHNNFGVLLEKEKQYNQALYHYQQALKIKPDYIQARLGLGDVYYKQGQLPLSLEAYLEICNEHKRASKRVAELLRENRYRNPEGKTVIKAESLTLLFNPKRLEKLYQKATLCHDDENKSIAPVSELKAILKPIIVFRQQIQFKVGKFDLSLITDKQLNNIAIALKKIKATKVIIRGHSDNQRFQGFSQIESDEKNQELSENRAKSVSQALVANGIINSSIKTKGYGYKLPLVKGNNENAWAKNRRVEIEVQH